MSAQQALLTILDQKIQADTLVLPTLPEIALKIRRIAELPDTSLANMAEVVAQDPALAARLVKLANSAFLGRTIKCSTLLQAVTRIGLSQIKHVATALALEQLFVSKYPVVQQQLDKLWRENIQVAAISTACLKLYQQQHPATVFSVDKMTLCGLVHNIGALAVIAEAERHPEVFGHPVFLHNVSEKVAPYISIKVLQAWGFDEEFQTAAKNWRLCKASQPPEYTDFIRLAAIARGYYKSAEAEMQLLQHYLEQQLIAVPQFAKQPQFTELYQDIRSLFT
ncbi:HDOD domain-containing protein [Alishewanella jeotgali]|uniref:Putative signal transduction protein n=1 Tax=Alishewanella jeotgali KCTC 22429 TaxID=1129374 RepID=H3ZGZ1_9ALTE|nr:HDOD domain-containing protein [Alishewanella jeotgali]EHR40131.1 putative signal transduction protein [Alishewanella jeotgali KCTC 22429]